MATKMIRISGLACIVAALAATTVAWAGRAHAHPVAAAQREYVVTLAHGTDHAAGRALIRAAGGRVTRDLHIINAFGARLSASAARRLASRGAVVAVTPNRRVGTSRTTSLGGSSLLTAFNASLGTDRIWTGGHAATGRGVTVAVIDTGIAGDLADFRTSQSNPASRVIASVVTNPDATTASDGYGHGTHVAGLIAGNGFARPATDPLYGKYAGTAPDANLVSIKASDDHGNATLLDVINGLQFAVDMRATYAIRVINLSLDSTTANPAATDPLDAAVEQAWLHGLVVVAAAGNRGTDTDAVTYAPSNDPYAIVVGALDDAGTKTQRDDTPASWSSRGSTLDGVSKPDLLAPGAHLVSVLSPNSDFAQLCPTCILGDGQYIKLGGTSMAAATASGVIADLLQAHPTWTPDQVKAVLINTTRTLNTNTKEIAADIAIRSNPTAFPNPNAHVTPNTLLDPATATIDYTRASWTQATWTTATDPLRASWGATSWTCACTPTDSTTIYPSRASWSRASWSSSWDK